MSGVKPIPDGYTAITPYLIVEDAAMYLDFLVNALGAVERMRLDMPEEGIGHAEVEIDGAIVMLADASLPDFPTNDTNIHRYVQDVDGVFAQAVDAGATSISGPADQFYGDRAARISDPCGNQQTIACYVEGVYRDEV